MKPSEYFRGRARAKTGPALLASMARYAIIVYAVFAALTQLGIAVQLTANTFLILLGAVALAALAFGLGGREVARDVLQRAYNRSDEVTGGGGNRPAARRRHLFPTGCHQVGIN